MAGLGLGWEGQNAVDSSRIGVELYKTTSEKGWRGCHHPPNRPAQGSPQGQSQSEANMPTRDNTRTGYCSGIFATTATLGVGRLLLYTNCGSIVAGLLLQARPHPHLGAYGNVDLISMASTPTAQCALSVPSLCNTLFAFGRSIRLTIAH